MFKKKAIDRLSGELGPEISYTKQPYRKSPAYAQNRISSPNSHNLNISSNNKFIPSSKLKVHSQQKHQSYNIDSSQSIQNKIYSSQQLKLNQCLTINLQTSKELKTVQFKYNNSATIKSLITFLKHQIRQSNVIFQGPNIMVDYLLTLENELVINLKGKKIGLKAVPLRTHQFVNNPLINFRILKCIGAGGFSKVFLVQAYGIYMALKVIPKKLLRDNDKETIVMSEKNILIEMKRHPFITKVHYAFETSKNICLALEYCPGGQLFYLLKKIKRMKQHQAQFYFLEVLSALKALHQKGIIYRDLKPQNIIIDHEGHIRLADFGLSKQLKQEITYSFCGSAEYMAPQMLLKQGHDFSIDYYCIGALLYQLVTGLPPYYCKNQQQLFTNILTHSLQFPDQKVSLSPAIKSMLKGLLHKNPKKRLGSSMGIMEIFAHPWITKLNIPDLVNKKLKPPHKPDLLVYNFDDAEYEQKQIDLIRQLEQQSKQINVKNQMFEDFYFQSKDMQIQLQSLKNNQKRQSLNKQRVYKSPQSRLYLHNSYERISSPKHYAFIKTRSPVRQDIMKNPEKDHPLFRYSSSQNQKSKLDSNGTMYYRRSVQNHKVGQSKGSSVQGRKAYENKYRRQSEERKNNSREIIHNSLKYISPFSPKYQNVRMGSNVQSPRKIQQLTRVKSSQILKRGFIQKDKIKSYFNR